MIQTLRPETAYITNRFYSTQQVKQRAQATEVAASAFKIFINKDNQTDLKFEGGHRSLSQRAAYRFLTLLVAVTGLSGLAAATVPSIVSDKIATADNDWVNAKKQEALAKSDLKKFIEDRNQLFFQIIDTDDSDPTRALKFKNEAAIFNEILHQVLVGRPDIQDAINAMPRGGITLTLVDKDILTAKNKDGSVSKNGAYYSCDGIKIADKSLVDDIGQDSHADTVKTHAKDLLALISVTLNCLGEDEAQMQLAGKKGLLPQMTTDEQQMFESERKRLIENIDKGESKIQLGGITPVENKFLAAVITTFFTDPETIRTESPDKLWPFLQEYFNVQMADDKTNHASWLGYTNDEIEVIESERLRLLDLANRDQFNGSALNLLDNKSFMDYLSSLNQDQRQSISPKIAKIFQVYDNYDETGKRLTTQKYADTGFPVWSSLGEVPVSREYTGKPQYTKDPVFNSELDRQLAKLQKKLGDARLVVVEADSRFNASSDAQDLLPFIIALPGCLLIVFFKRRYNRALKAS